MRTTWIVGIFMLHLLGTAISLTIEGRYLGTGLVDTFFRVMKPEFGSFSNPLTAIGGFFIMVWAWMQALWAVFWWDYSFFTGYWEVLQYVGWCVSIGIIVSLVLAARGVGSS